MMIRSCSVVAALALGFVGCGNDSQQRKDAVKRYAEVASAMYGDTLTTAQAMQVKINAFTDAPSQANLDAAKDAWKTARIAYEKTEALRFYGGPIDNGQAGEPEASINPWPLDENFIDSTEGDPNAGIINSTEPITEASLRAQNGATGETNLTIGWHAIEFLLWGQDLSVTGAGNRPFTDYSTAPNATRRAAYLKAATNILLEDLSQVEAQWKLADSTTYGAKFVAAADPNASLTLAIKGIGNFLAGELNRERINNAYATKDQEEEHSCFSDTTVPIDLPESVKGVKLLLNGTLTGTDGASLQALIEAKNPTVAAQLKADTDAAVAAIDAIPAPFDQAILGDDASPGRVKILASVNANKKLALTLADVASELGLSLDFDYCPEGETSCRPQ